MGHTVKSYLVEFAIHTSLTVFYTILIFQNILVRLFWTSVFLIATASTIYQCVVSLGLFYSYPVQVKIELAFHQLEFPAVTMCNLNPYKKSMIDTYSPTMSGMMKAVKDVKNTMSRNATNSPSTSHKRRKRSCDYTTWYGCPDNGCGSEWYNVFQYYCVNPVCGKKNWPDAVSCCAQMDSVLPFLLTQAGWQTVAPGLEQMWLAYNGQPATPFWIGLYLGQNNTWYWPDGTPAGWLPANLSNTVNNNVSAMFYNGTDWIFKAQSVTPSYGTICMKYVNVTTTTTASTTSVRTSTSTSTSSSTTTAISSTTTTTVPQTTTTTTAPLTTTSTTTPLSTTTTRISTTTTTAVPSTTTTSALSTTTTSTASSSSTSTTNPITTSSAITTTTQLTSTTTTQPITTSKVTKQSTTTTIAKATTEKQTVLSFNSSLTSIIQLTTKNLDMQSSSAVDATSASSVRGFNLLTTTVIPEAIQATIVVDGSTQNIQTNTDGTTEVKIYAAETTERTRTIDLTSKSEVGEQSSLEATSTSVEPPLTTPLSQDIVRQESYGEFVEKFNMLGNDSNPISLVADVQDDLQYMNKEMGEAKATQLGYTADDVITYCTFNDTKCTAALDFVQFNDPTFGNCYTFNVDNKTRSIFIPGQNYVSTVSTIFEINSGLKLRLNVSQNEYLETSTFSGFRIVVHDPAFRPYPDSIGFYVPPGFKTAVSFRMRANYQLPPPIGICNNDNDYSVEKCYRQCQQKFIVAQCGCGDPVLPIQAGQRYCTREEKSCVSNFKDTTEYSNDVGKCSCPQRCREKVYFVTMSKSMFRSVNENALDYASTQDKILNIVELELFFSVLNLETYTEQQAYPMELLLGDIGNFSGWLLGISMISFFEIIILFVHLCSAILKKK